MTPTDKIIIYGTSWCGGSRRVRLFMDRYCIPFEWVDIEKDEQAAERVEGLNRGFRTVPTIVWPDGSSLTEPSDEALAKKLGIKLS